MILIPFLGSMSIIGADAVIGIGIHTLSTTVPADDEEQAQVAYLHPTVQRRPCGSWETPAPYEAKPK